MNWLTPNLRESVRTLQQKIRLPDYTSVESKDRERRTHIVSVGAVLPGIRMCERRNLLLLAQSAPIVAAASIEQTLVALATSFEAEWNADQLDREQILEDARRNLSTLYEFAEQIEEIYVRREEATRILETLDHAGTLARPAPNFEPVYPYLGYEVVNLTRGLNTIQYPAALKKDRHFSF